MPESVPLRPFADRARAAQVDQGRTVGRDDDVLRRDVSVDERLCVKGAERVEHVAEEELDRRPRRARAFGPDDERRALDESRDDVRAERVADARTSEGEELREPWMPDGAERQELGPKEVDIVIARERAADLESDLFAPPPVASTSEAVIRDCTPRSSREDRRFPWCCFETSPNGTAYCRNGDSRYNTIVTMHDAGYRKACCVPHGTRMNVGPAPDISTMTQPPGNVLCYNAGHCWRI